MPTPSSATPGSSRVRWILLLALGAAGCAAAHVPSDAFDGGSSGTGDAGSGSTSGSGDSDAGSPAHPGTFGLSAPAGLGSPPTIGMNSQVALTLARVGGGSDAATVHVSRQGGCGPAPLEEDVEVAAGIDSVPVALRTPNNVADCRTAITSVVGGTAAAPPGDAVTVHVDTSPPRDCLANPDLCTEPQPSCPAIAPGSLALPSAPPGGNVPGAINFGGNDIFRPNSGQIMYMPLPILSDWDARYAAGRVQFNETVYSPPSPAVREISISRCPGVIDDSVPACYVKSDLHVTTSQYFALSWIETAQDSPSHDCPALKAQGTWYVNVRFVYSDVCWGGNCGYVGQWIQWSP